MFKPSLPLFWTPSDRKREQCGESPHEFSSTFNAAKPLNLSKKKKKIVPSFDAHKSLTFRLKGGYFQSPRKFFQNLLFGKDYWLNSKEILNSLIAQVSSFYYSKKSCKLRCSMKSDLPFQSGCFQPSFVVIQAFSASEVFVEHALARCRVPRSPHGGARERVSLKWLIGSEDARGTLP